MNTIYLVQVEDRVSHRYLGVWMFSTLGEFDAFEKNPDHRYVPLGDSNCTESMRQEVDDHGPIWDGVV